MKAWLNGTLVVSEVPGLFFNDRGFTLGDGVFETLRIADGSPRHFGLHLDRLRMGAGILDIPLPGDGEELADAVAAVLNANGVHDGSARITLTRGRAARGVLPPKAPRPTLLVTAAHAAPMAATVLAVIATTVRRNENSPLSRIKSLNYLDNILARQEADRRGADEAILLNAAGRVAEASSTNIFAVLDGSLVTPPVEEGALPGIVRRLVLETGEASERPLTPQDLRQAREIVLTSSLGIRNVTRLDGTPVGRSQDTRAADRIAAIARMRR